MKLTKLTNHFHLDFCFSTIARMTQSMIRKTISKTVVDHYAPIVHQPHAPSVVAVVNRYENFIFKLMIILSLFCWIQQFIVILEKLEKKRNVVTNTVISFYRLAQLCL